jgi:hypothetical protein
MTCERLPYILPFIPCLVLDHYLSSCPHGADEEVNVCVRDEQAEWCMRGYTARSNGAVWMNKGWVMSRPV